MAGRACSLASSGFLGCFPLPFASSGYLCCPELLRGGHTRRIPLRNTIDKSFWQLLVREDEEILAIIVAAFRTLRGK